MRWASIKKRVLFTAIVITAVIVLLLPTKFGPVIDKYNPFYGTKEYYTIVKDIGQHIGDDWYEYEFVGYDEKGKERKITKTVKHMLKRNEPLKIFAKGRYGESLVEIDTDQIPIKARTKLLTMR